MTDYLWVACAFLFLFLLLERRESRYWRRQYEHEWRRANQHFDTYTKALLALHAKPPKRGRGGRSK